MGAYALGVDLGTTFTAASVHTGQRPEPVTLGARSLGIPSVVYVLGDGGYRIGEEATAPAMEDPSRLVYEFKRHIGSDTNLLLPDGAYPPTHFSTLLLRWVHDRVVRRMHDELPAVVAVSHPAHWNEHQLARHREVLRDAGLADALTVSEPEAAAIYYATQAPVADGDVVAVYDLGGGTFDTAVVRREGDGFTILGQPAGIGHLGGGDFDKVIYAIVNDHLDGALGELDASDPEVLTDLHVLAEECTRGKEQLSANTHVTIPVRVGPVKQTIRVTRPEFEQAIRPRVAETISTLEATLRSADVHPSELSRVLLVGGSSRIPLVRAMVEEALGVPVSEDNDPVAAVAVGASIFAHLHAPAAAGAAVGAGAAPAPLRLAAAAPAEGPGGGEAGQDEVPVRIRGGMTPLDPPAPALERAPRLRVVGSDGTAVEAAGGEVLRVGRGSDNDVVVPGDVVSRHHGRFHFDERDGWRFTDAGSRNGTYLDGVRLPEASGASGERSVVLPPRAVLRLGATGPELHVELEAAPTAPGSGVRLRCGGRVLTPYGNRRFVIGRSPTADLVVDDPTRRVSTTHLELRPSGTGWVLVDVSANGSFRPDGPIGLDPLPVSPGLELRLGAVDGPVLLVEDPAQDAGDALVGSTVTVGRSAGRAGAGAASAAADAPTGRGPAIGAGPGPGGGGGGPDEVPWWRRWRPWGVGAVAVVVLAAASGAALLGDDGDGAVAGGTSTSTSAADPGTVTSSSSTLPPTTSPPVGTVAEVAVPGDAAWTDTGLDVASGDHLALVATGSVRHDTGDAGSAVGPDGATADDIADPALNTPGEGVYRFPPGHGGLVGWIAPGASAGAGCTAPADRAAVFGVGAAHERIVERPGRLCLGINDYNRGAVDDAVANNDGAFAVTVTVTPGG